MLLDHYWNLNVLYQLRVEDKKKDEHIDSNCVNEPLTMALKEIDNEMRHFLSSSSHIKTIHMHCFYGYSDKWTHFIV